MSLEDKLHQIAEMLDILTDHTAVIREEVMPVQLQVATQMAAALLPHMLHHTPHHLAERAVTLADALIDEVTK